MQNVLARLLLCLTTCVAVIGAVEGPPPVETSAPHVGYIQIDGIIDSRRAQYFKRTLDEAVRQRLDAVVVHLTTDGGHLDAALAMLHAALSVAHADEGQPRLIAFIDNKAWSAGAMIAYSHQEIYLTPVAHIGDIGVITITADGQIEYLPEKIESPVRAALRSAARTNGWPVAKLLKMTARNQSLYRFTLPDGSREYVIEDDLGVWLAERPNLSRDDAVLVLGEDRLISYTAGEAVEEGMATAVVRDLDEVYAKIGVSPAAVKDLSPTDTEEWAWWLGTFAPLLAGLAVLFLILEMQTPGVGLFITLAAICGGLFFATQYALELASHVELLLVLGGIALIIAEVFWLPTGGIVGIGGFGLIVIGLVLAFMPNDLQFQVGDGAWVGALGDAITRSMIALGVLTAGMLWLIRALPHMRAVDRIAATGEISSTSAGDAEQGANSLIGRMGTTRSDLRPSGRVDLDGEEYSAVAEHGEHILIGSTVRVVDVRFGELIVRLVEGGLA